MANPTLKDIFAAGPQPAEDEQYGEGTVLSPPAEGWEGAEQPPPDKRAVEVLDEYRESSRDLEGFEAYHALINAREDLLKAVLLENVELGRSYLLGSKGNRDRMEKTIFDELNTSQGGGLSEFLVKSGKDELWSDVKLPPGKRPGMFIKGAQQFFPREFEALSILSKTPAAKALGVTQVPPPKEWKRFTPPRTAPLHNRHAELTFQALIGKDMSWDKLDDSDFIAYAELYADRHPDYKNSDQFKSIANRASRIRKEMAVRAVAEETHDPETGMTTRGIRLGGSTADITSPTWMAINEARREFGITDQVGEGTPEGEERSFNDTVRVLYHLEGESFGAAKTIGLLAGSLGVYGAAYKALAKKGLTKFWGEGAKQKVKSFGSMAAVEAGVNYGYNPEGHSIVSHIFNEGKPNKLLSMVEAIVIGSVFNLGIDHVRFMKGMKRHEVAGYLENKLPHGRQELAIIRPEAPPPGWHRPATVSGEVSERATQLNKQIHDLNEKIRKSMQGEVRMTPKKKRFLDNRQKKLEVLNDELKLLTRTPEEAAAIEGTVGEAWANAKGMPRLETKEQLQLMHEPLTESQRVAQEIEENAARHQFLQDHARKLRETARFEAHAGRREEALLLHREAKRIDTERKAIRPSGEKPLGSRMARRQEAEAKAGFTEDIGRGEAPIAAKRTMQDMVDDVVKEQERETRRLTHVDDSLRNIDNVVTDGGTNFKALIDDIPDDVMAAMRSEVARIARPTEFLEQLHKQDAANLRKILHLSQKELKTSNERIALAKAAAEQAEKGGMSPHTQQAFADVAHRELYIYPAIAKELAQRAGFGFATGAVGEDEGYDYWTSWMFGFSLFNPKFAKSSGHSMGIKTPRARRGAFDHYFEQIMTGLQKIHPRLMGRLANFDTVSLSRSVIVKKEHGKYFRSLEEAEIKGELSAVERKDISDTLIEIGTHPKMREKVAAMGERLAASNRSSIISAEEFVDQFNSQKRITDALREEFIESGGKAGWIEYHFPRAIRKDKLSEYNKAMGIPERSIGDEAVREFEKSTGRKLDVSGYLPSRDKQLDKAIRNKAAKDMGAGVRAAGVPRNVKQRKMDLIDDKVKHMYERDHASWGQYVDEMIYAIEKNKLFGKGVSPEDLLKSEIVPPGVERILDDSIGGILSSLRYPDRILTKGTVVNYADGTRRTLTKDTFFSNFRQGDVKRLAKGEERRLKAKSEVGGQLKGVTKFGRKPISQADQEDMVYEMFHNRFAAGRQPMPEWANAGRAITHVLTLGQFSSTLTQGGDLGLIAETETLRTALKMMGESGEKTFQDALRWISKGKVDKARPENLIYLREEFNIGAMGVDSVFNAGKSTGFVGLSQQAAQSVLTYTGFRHFDDMLKTAKLNATLYNLRKGIKARVSAGGKTTYEVTPEIRARFGEAFGKDFDDLARAVVEKDWNNWNLKTAVLMELGKIQPVTLSNLPAGYITAGGFGKMCYTLKTFQLTYINHLRRAVLAKVANGAKLAMNPKTRDEGVRLMKEGGASMSKLFLYFGGITFGINNFNNFINGREFDPKGAGWAAIATAMGASKFQIYDAVRNMERFGGVWGTAYTGVKTILPAGVSIIDTVVTDVIDILQGEGWEKIEMLKYLPFAGRPAHGAVGAGKQREQKAKAKEAGKSKMPVTY